MLGVVKWEGVILIPIKAITGNSNKPHATLDVTSKEKVDILLIIVPFKCKDGMSDSIELGSQTPWGQGRNTDID